MKTNETNNFPRMLPTVSSITAKEFPQIPLSSGSFHLVGTHGEFALYEFCNQRMGGKSLKVLHVRTGWLKRAPDKTTAALMASRYLDGLNGIAPDFGGEDGWGKTQTFSWKKQ